jgi:hypothetical protein
MKKSNMKSICALIDKASYLELEEIQRRANIRRSYLDLINATTELISSDEYLRMEVIVQAKDGHDE